MLFNAEFGFDVCCNVFDVSAYVNGYFLCEDECVSAFLTYGFDSLMNFCFDGCEQCLLLFLEVLLSGLTELSHFLVKFLEFFFATFFDGCGGVGSELLIFGELFVELVLEFLEFVFVFFACFCDLGLSGSCLGHSGEDGVDVYYAEFLSGGGKCDGCDGQSDDDFLNHDGLMGYDVCCY